MPSRIVRDRIRARGVGRDRHRRGRRVHFDLRPTTTQSQAVSFRGRTGPPSRGSRSTGRTARTGSDVQGRAVVRAGDVDLAAGDGVRVAPSPTQTVVSPIRLSGPQVPASACGSPHSATPESIPEKPGGMCSWIALQVLVAVFAGHRRRERRERARLEVRRARRQRRRERQRASRTAPVRTASMISNGRRSEHARRGVPRPRRDRRARRIGAAQRGGTQRRAGAAEEMQLQVFERELRRFLERRDELPGAAQGPACTSPGELHAAHRTRGHSRRYTARPGCRNGFGRSRTALASPDTPRLPGGSGSSGVLISTSATFEDSGQSLRVPIRFAASELPVLRLRAARRQAIRAGGVQPDARGQRDGRVLDRGTPPSRSGSGSLPGRRAHRPSTPSGCSPAAPSGATLDRRFEAQTGYSHPGRPVRRRVRERVLLRRGELPDVLPTSRLRTLVCSGPVHDVGMIKNGCGFSWTGHDGSQLRERFDDPGLRAVQAVVPRVVSCRGIGGDTPERDLATDERPISAGCSGRSRSRRSPRRYAPRYRG